jgi:hypothetical protein
MLTGVSTWCRGSIAGASSSGALTHGTLSDWFMVKDYYGKGLIKAESLEIRYLDRQTLAFCSAYF